MANNKLYVLSVDDMELNSFKSDKKRNEIVDTPDCEPVYLNTTLPREKVSEDDDSDYAVLNRTSTFLHNSQPPLSSQVKESNVTPKNGKHVMLLMYTLLGLVVVLFLAGSGTAIALGITASKAGASIGTWSAWESWSHCSVSCGLGNVYRNRTCMADQYCVGDTNEHKLCHETLCPANNGGWAEWSSWGDCSSRCMKTRNRTCTNPVPSDNGQMCQGNFEDKEICNLTACGLTPIHGGWSEWSGWEQCSATCNTGIETRHRSCSMPRPSNGGDYCYGESTEFRLCNNANCEAINGQWSSWTVWSECSWSTCMKNRSRNCTNPAPSAYGRMCEGNSVDKNTCNLQVCAWTTVYLRMRLVNGTNTSSGRVEVSQDGYTWGTVCDDGFDYNDARVVCKMLGRTGGTVIDSSSTVDGVGPIFLDDLQCTGSETSLLYCPNIGWGSHNCGHSEDVGVSCS